MPDPNPETDLLDPLLRHVAERITPLFETKNTGKADARAIAISALAAYNPKSRADFVNIARILAFSIASIAALGLAAVEDLPSDQKMRYFGRASALNRSADEAERMMMRRRDQPTAPPPPAEAGRAPNTAITARDEAALDAAVDEALASYRATTASKAAAKSEPRTARPNPTQAAAILRTPDSGHRPTTSHRQTLLNGSAMPHGGGSYPQSPLA